MSSTVAELARGLVEGVTMRTKVLAATLLVAGALGMTGGALVLSKADAQGGGGGGSGGFPGGTPGAGGQPGPGGAGGGGGGGKGGPGGGGSSPARVRAVSRGHRARAYQGWEAPAKAAWAGSPVGRPCGSTSSSTFGTIARSSRRR